MLTAPPHRHARNRAALPEECAVGILLLTTPGDHFLDDDLAGRHDRRGPAEGGKQLRRGVGPPRLSVRGVEEVLLYRGFQDHRVIDLDRGQVLLRPREPRPGYRDRQALGQAVYLPLVPGMPD